MKRVKKVTICFLCVVLLVAALPITNFSLSKVIDMAKETEAAVTSMDTTTYNTKVNNFISDNRYKQGASCTNCFNYTQWFTQYMFAKNPRDGEKFANPSGIRAGDILHFYHSWSTGSSQHWIVVLARDGNNLYTAEGNVNSGKVRISNSQYWIEGNQLKEKGCTITSFDCGYHHASIASSYNPEGNVDAVSGGTQNIHVRGWVFDRDDTSRSLEVHVYIGGGPGEAKAEGHSITANVERTDVNRDYNVGNYHGFDSIIPVKKTGTYPVYIYAINVGGGDNRLLYSGTVTIGKSEYLGTDFDAYIVNPNSGKRLVNQNGNVILAPIQENANDIWRFSYQDDGYYKITNKGNGQVLDLAGAISVNGTNIQTYSSNGTDAQRWCFCKVGSNYVIQSKCSRQVIDIDVASSNVQIWDKHGGTNQLFMISKVTYYQVSYNANGGSGAPGSQTKTYEKNLTLSTTKPTRTGYTFAGWNTKADGTGTGYAAGSKYTANANVTLYAKWTSNTYTVIYNGNGATSGSTASSSHTYNTAKTLTANGYSKTGYTFKGWNTKADGSGTAYTNSQSVKNLTATNKGTVTLYAQWTKNTYTVKYDGNGATSGSTVSSSHTYDTAKALTANGYSKIGYTFKGWNTKADGSGTAYTNSQSVKNLTATNKGTVTLYAQWTKNTYTVKYDGNGATSGSTASSSHTYDTAKALTANGYSKSGYTFNGWNTKADGSGTTYTNSQSVKNLTVTNKGSITLYAQWRKIVYNPSGKLESVSGGVQSISVKGWTFDRDDLSKALSLHIYIGGPAGSNIGVYAGSITANLWRDDVEKVYPGVGKYHGFEGTIYTSKTGNQPIYVYAINVGSGTNVLLGTKTVTIEPYTITYNANGGTNAPAKQTKTYNDIVVLNSSVPTRTGYTFSCWNTKIDGTGTSYVKGAKYTENANITLYAQWTPNEYTLTINPNGGTIKTENGKDYTTKPISYNTKLVFDKANWWKVSSCERTGYNFNGFYTTVSGGIKVYNENGECTNEGKYFKNKIYVYPGNLNIYAQWTPNTYTVVYNGNGSTSGSTVSSSHTYDTEKALTANGYSKSGYTFTGWNTKADGSGVAYSNSQSVKNLIDTNKGIVTLYAQWKKIVYNPSGKLESVSGSVQSISVKGWTFDREDLSKALSIHIYIGGPAGSSTGAYAGTITANAWRSDVEKVYPGVGNYHGFEGTIYTSKTGNQPVYVYAINVGGGKNVLLGTKTVTIEPYTVTYNANGGMVAPAEQTKTYENTITLSKSIPSRTGYTFTGWNTKADGTGTNYVAGASYTSNSSVTLYAQWRINTYTVSYNVNGGMGVPANQTKTYGTDLTLSLTEPTRTGYTFTGWNTKADGSGTSYAKGGTYTANEAVTLYAQWKKNAADLPFTDVKKGTWQYTVARYVYERNIMTGTSDTKFSPGMALTRGQLVNILWRMEECPSVVYKAAFPDVPDGKYYTSAVLWANSKGIVNGYKTGLFGPSNDVTRQDFIVILYNYARYKGYSTATSGTTYTECSDYQQVSSYAKTAIEWAYERGLIGANGTLNPKGNASRIEAAAMLQRFLEYYGQ